MRDLVPRPGVEPGPLALGAWSLTTGSPGKSPAWFSYKGQIFARHEGLIPIVSS